MTKIFRVSTVPVSLNILLKGQLKFLNRYFKVTAVSGEAEDLREVAAREGVETIPLAMERKISPVKDFVSLVKMYFLLKKEKPAVVHSITPKAGLITMLAGKLAGVPIRMHTFTGLIFPSKTGMMQKILIAMDQLLCAAATNIYPEGDGVKKDLETFGITKKPLHILGNGNVNGIDMEYYHPEKILEQEKAALKKTLNIQQEDTVFIFVGRLVRDKGIHELVEAFSQLTNPRVKLLLVGPYEQDLDPLDARTTAQIQENKNIISVGFQKDIRPYLAISDIFVFPSYREGFPNVVLQAGAMQMPCIVTNISGSNEIIIPAQNGVIIPVKDSAALKEEMQDLLARPDKVKAMRNNARKMVADRYEQSYVWEKLLEEYRRLLQNKA